MLMTPLPWDMTSWRMKRKFGKLWYWLKQKQDIRLAMVGIKPEFDTLMIATEVLQRVDQYTLNSLVTDINKGLPVDIVKSLLRYSVWKSSKMSHLNFSIVAFSTNFCLTKNAQKWSNSVTRQKLTKNAKIQMRHFGWFSNNVWFCYLDFHAMHHDF